MSTIFQRPYSTPAITSNCSFVVRQGGYLGHIKAVNSTGNAVVLNQGANASDIQVVSAASLNGMAKVSQNIYIKETPVSLIGGTYTGGNNAVLFQSQTLQSVSLLSGNLKVSSGGSLCEAILSGKVSVYGQAQNISIVSGGSVVVFDDGQVEGVTINPNASLVVASGGRALIQNPIFGTLVSNTGADIDYLQPRHNVYYITDNTVTPAEAVQSIPIKSASMYVYNNGTVESTIISSIGSLHVSSGGTANATAINSRGYLNVSNGGTANSTTVNSSGSMTVSSGGTANNTTINYGGRLYVSSGGTANATAINSYGYMSVDSGGTADNTTVNEYGYLYVSSGGMADNTTVNEYGYLYVSSGGMADRTTVNSGGNLLVCSGGMANITWCPSIGTIRSSAGANITYNTSQKVIYWDSERGVLSNADILSNITVSDAQLLVISSAGKAVNISVNSGGNLSVLSGGTLQNFNIAEGGNLYVGAGALMGVAKYIIGTQIISTADTLTNISMIEYGSIFISSGARIDGLTATASNRITIFQGGSLLGANIDNGYLHVSGGYAANVSLGPSGYTYISNLGTVNSVILQGSMVVQNSCKASNISFASGGKCTVSSGGKLYIHYTPWININSIGGAVVSYFNTGSVKYWDPEQGVIDTANVLTNISISNGQYVAVDSRGSVANTTVQENGNLVLGAGHSRVDASALPGAYIYLSSAFLGTDNILLTPWPSLTNIISHTSAAYVTTQIPGVFYGDPYSFTNTASISDFIVESGKQLTIHSGGVAENIFVQQGGILSLEGGTLSNFTVSSGSGLYIKSGATATDITVEPGGYVVMDSGGTFNGATTFTKLQSGTRIVSTNQNLLFIGTSGKLYVSSGGAVNLLALAGSNTVYAASAHIYSSGLVNGAVMLSSGSMYIFSGGSVNGVVISSTCGLTVYSGGTATNVSQVGGIITSQEGAAITYVNSSVKPVSYISATNLIYAGDRIQYLNPKRNTSLVVRSGGTAHDIILSSASLAVHPDGNVYDISAIANGQISILQQASVTGTILGRYRDTVSIAGYADTVKLSNSAKMYVKNSASVNSAQLGSYVDAYISSGGTVNSISLAGGRVYLYEGGCISDLAMEGGTIQNSGGIISNLTIVDGGTLTYTSEINAANLNIQPYAAIIVPQGETLSSLAISTHYFIVSGGTLNSVTVEPGASLHLSGGIATSLTVSSGGSALITYATEEGKLISGEVEPGGLLVVAGSSATADNLTIKPGGSLVVSLKAMATICKQPWMGSITSYTETVVSYLEPRYKAYYGNAQGIISTGNTLAGLLIQSGKQLFVYQSGSARNIQVRKGGHISAESCYMTSITISSGGVLQASGILQAQKVRILPGGSLIQDGSTYCRWTPWTTESLIGSFNSQGVVYYGNPQLGAILSKSSIQSLQVTSGYSAIVMSGGVLSNVTVQQGGSLYVHSGGSANITSLPFDIQSPYIHLQRGALIGYANKYDIYYGKASTGVISVASNQSNLQLTSMSAHIYRGYLQAVTVQKDGELAVQQPVSIANAKVFAKGHLRLSGASLGVVSLQNGSLSLDNNTSLEQLSIISSGGFIRVTRGDVPQIHVQSGLEVLVGSAGSGSNLSVLQEGLLQVAEAGEITSTYIDTTGVVKISSKGKAQETFIDTNGSLIISSGGLAISTTVQRGAEFTVAPGATASYVIIKPQAQLYISHGAFIQNTVISPYGSVIVTPGAMLYSTVVQQNIFVYIQSLAAVNYPVVKNYGSLIVSGNAYVISGTVMSNGVIQVLQGGTVQNTNITSGGDIRLRQGGSAVYIHVINQGDWAIGSTGKVISPIIQDGILRVSSNSNISAVSVTEQGSLVVAGEAIVSQTQISSGGSVLVYVDGTAYDTTIYQSGILSVHSGSARQVVVQSGSLYVTGGEVADVNALHGLVQVSRTGTISGLTLQRGASAVATQGGGIYNAELYSGANLSLLSGGFVEDANINSDATLYLLQGGEIYTADIKSQGVVKVQSSGVLYAANIAGHGSIVLQSYGSASDYILSSGVSMLVSQLGYANSVTVTQGAEQYILSGGSATNNNISGGTASIHEGGVAQSDTVQDSNGKLYILSGGIDNNCAVKDHGSVIILNGGTANSPVVSDLGSAFVAAGGTLNAAIQRGGYLDAATISSGMISIGTYGNASIYGTATIHSGTTFSNVSIQPGGTVIMFRDGSLTEASIASDGILSCVQDSAHLQSLTIGSGGSVVACSGGIIQGLQISSGAILSAGSLGAVKNTIVSDGGSLFIAERGGLPSSEYDNSSNIISNGGSLFILDGGVAVDTIIKGKMEIFSSSGNITTSVYLASDIYLTPEAQLHCSVFQGGYVVTLRGNVGGLIGPGGDAAIGSGGLTVFMGAQGSILGSYSKNYINVRGGEGEIRAGTCSTAIVQGGGIIRSNASTAETFLGSLAISAANVSNCSVGIFGSVGISSGALVSSLKFTDAICDPRPPWISEGSPANYVGALKGGNVTVSADGIIGDVNFTQNYQGCLTVRAAGLVNSVLLDKFNSVIVSSAGTLNNIKQNGGYLDIKKGGTVSFITYNSINNFTVGLSRTDGFSVQEVYRVNTTVHSNTSIISCSVGPGGTLHTFQGGKIQKLNMNGGSAIIQSGTQPIVEASINTFDKYVLHMTNQSTARLIVRSGASVFNILQNGGGVVVQPGATVTFVSHSLTSLSAGIDLITPRPATDHYPFEDPNDWLITVHSGTTIGNCKLLCWPSIVIYSSGSVENLSLYSYATAIIHSGGYVQNLYLNGGTCIKEPGATVVNSYNSW